VWPTGENGRHPLASSSDAAMTESEDPTMQRDQPPAFDPTLNQILTQSQVNELAPSDDAVLLLSQFANRNRCLITYCNALSAQWADNALHLDPL
jgi:hypothetical protein